MLKQVSMNVPKRLQSRNLAPHFNLLKGRQPAFALPNNKRNNKT